jgi:hypothetical protein
LGSLCLSFSSVIDVATLLPPLRFASKYSKEKT